MARGVAPAAVDAGLKAVAETGRTSSGGGDALDVVAGECELVN